MPDQSNTRGDLLYKQCLQNLPETEREFLISEDEDHVHNLAELICPELMATVCGIKVPVLLDSGAQVNCVSEEFHRKIINSGWVLPVVPIPQMKIVGITGRLSSTITRQALLVIEGLGEAKYVSALVVRQLVQPVVLGVEFLQRYGISLDFHSRVVTIPTSESTLDTLPLAWRKRDTVVAKLSVEYRNQPTTNRREVDEYTTSIAEIEEAVAAAK